MTSLQDTLTKNAPLGQRSPYPTAYDKSLLHPVERALQRKVMGFSPELAFIGVDIWNCYELCWLTLKGKPVRAFASFEIPASSRFLAESKSVKLYLNSLNKKNFENHHQVAKLIEQDLSEVCGTPIVVNINPPEFANFYTNNFYCLDELDLEITSYQRDASFLAINHSVPMRDHVYTNLFKSHCLCTGQPDWGSVFISYEGPAISRESLLRYLLSFHDHVGFSENCIEQIYVDILGLAKPSKLTVFGRFTRRGGIDINPYRSNQLERYTNDRLIFQ